ncbi:thiamine phosphate synthase, partial [Anaerotignum sp.]|uniref:thiamine phosphate synthase n=1 Tax=Anaerotignum sp. TaxID=2039241 RepID=UPI002899C4DF
VTFDELKAICGAVKIPIVAIGGINNHNVAELRGTGIDGVAVVSAIFAAVDIPKATSEMKQKLESVVIE